MSLDLDPCALDWATGTISLDDGEEGGGDIFLLVSTSHQHYQM